MTDAVKTNNLSIRFGTFSLFNHLNVAIPKGRITSLIGPNGAGKTSFLLALLGFIPYEGEIAFFKPRARMRFGYVPQRIQLPQDATLTVIDFFALHLQTRPLIFGAAIETKIKTKDALAETGLTGYEKKKLVHLSGGEAQRVALAAALLSDPDILILDEAQSGVDKNGEELFERVVERKAKENALTVLMVSHDLHAVKGISDYVICVNREFVCAGEPEKTLTPEIIDRAFGHPAFYTHEHNHNEGSR